MNTWISSSRAWFPEDVWCLTASTISWSTFSISRFSLKFKVSMPDKDSSARFYLFIHHSVTSQCRLGWPCIVLIQAYWARHSSLHPTVGELRIDKLDGVEIFCFKRILVFPRSRPRVSVDYGVAIIIVFFVLWCDTGFSISIDMLLSKWSKTLRASLERRQEIHAVHVRVCTSSSHIAKLTYIHREASQSSLAIL